MGTDLRNEVHQSDCVIDSRKLLGQLAVEWFASLDMEECVVQDHQL